MILANIVLHKLSHELVGLCMWPGNKNKVLVERVQNTSVRITEGGLTITVIPTEPHSRLNGEDGRR